MITALKVIYLLSLGMVFLAYFFYPFLMWIIGRRQKTRVAKREYDNFDLPTLTIVVAAHNEEKNIAATIDSLLAQDYPKDKLKIMVFSDGSRDRTVQIVKDYERQGVELMEFKKNIGKTECQNCAVAKIKTTLVGFADGNVTWQPQAATILARGLMADKGAAVATGKLVLIKDGSTEKSNEGLFRKLDDLIKKGESALGRTIGAVGPIYMVKRGEYIKLSPKLVSDLVLPLLLTAQGRKVIYLARAQAREPASANIWMEFHRQKRMITQGLVALPVLWQVASVTRNTKLFLMIALHKYFRWFSVELLLLALVANVFLIFFGGSIIFLWLLVSELVLLILSIVGLIINKLERSAGPLQPLTYFVLLNIASLVGLINYFRGDRAITWKTQRS